MKAPRDVAMDALQVAVLVQGAGLMWPPGLINIHELWDRRTQDHWEK